MFDRAPTLMGLDQLDATELAQNPYVVGDASNVFPERLADRLRAGDAFGDQAQGAGAQGIGKRLGKTVVD